MLTEHDEDKVEALFDRAADLARLVAEDWPALFPFQGFEVATGEDGEPIPTLTFGTPYRDAFLQWTPGLPAMLTDSVELEEEGDCSLSVPLPPVVFEKIKKHLEAYLWA